MDVAEWAIGLLVAWTVARDVINFFHKSNCDQRVDAARKEGERTIIMIDERERLARTEAMSDLSRMLKWAREEVETTNNKRK